MEIHNACGLNTACGGEQLFFLRMTGYGILFLVTCAKEGKGDVFLHPYKIGWAGQLMNTMGFRPWVEEKVPHPSVAPLATFPT